MVQSRENGITILLGLKGYEVEGVTEEKVGIIVVVKAAREVKGNCPGCSSTMLYRHGSAKKRRLLHSWSNGKKVYLELERHRWQCCECGPSVSEGWSRTTRPYSRVTRQVLPVLEGWGPLLCAQCYCHCEPR